MTSRYAALVAGAAAFATRAPWWAALALAASCAGGASAGAGEGADANGARLAAAGPYVVSVNPDGSFLPSSLIVPRGSTVIWNLADHTDTVIPTYPGVLPGTCGGSRPYEPGGFAGPARAPAGIFSLGPDPKGVGRGLEERLNSCGAYEDRGNVGNLHLCQRGTPGATMASTWDDPALSGVFIRMIWAGVNPSQGVYDFNTLDREVNEAVAHGKLYSIVFEAGKTTRPCGSSAPASSPCPASTCGTRSRATAG